ncbi:glutamate 2,3-aminomutase [Herbivorax sp. ANBcel31]|uniref:glutamate 2,3-aminomutase n=1 Tax=Herbivorax sp. ANBcel31 TaxID=3069754 RepID=UPI0027B31CF2|nr:glutamate 2,3-aminomutase [Herbivorax sp. ANBcel31]MDQ2086176.1 glutamate 2,3-aminomutase [Herbivorax sp. ANBcel31]
MEKQCTKREIALKRAEELKNRIKDYNDVKDTIPRGMSSTQEEKISEKRKQISSLLNATENDWNDWKWQIKNRIHSIDLLSKIIELDNDEIQTIKKIEEKFRWGISPYYASLIDDDPFNPVKLQSIPSHHELHEEGDSDPMGEEYTNPAGSITRRYPDRLIINTSNICAMYCRHCQRRRNIGTSDNHTATELLKESIEYVRKNPEIRDVLITGGDPLTMSDSTIDWLLGELHSIPSVEYIRLGSRTLVTMPQRITDDLINILKKYPPIFLNTHFNHPLELTKESKAACDKLADNGIVLGNQAVLLNGINNDKYVMRLLNHELLKCRVRPYYIFHAKHVSGTTHFNTSIDDGIEIVEYLRGYTSGLAIPTYIVNAPGGNGKTPISPQYVVSRGKDHVKIRTWEGKVFDYPNHPTKNIKE